MVDAVEDVMDTSADQIEAAPPIRSRFLFVDVSAQRAKQLRRGALPRIREGSIDPETGHRRELPHKLERLAMEEVRSGLVQYALPDAKTPPREGIV